MAATRPVLRLASGALLLGLAVLWQPAPASAGPKPDSYWQVDDIQPGMKGKGRTVMKGTTIETFDAEVLGVLKNTSPGRDLVLCRLSGLDLDRTGVIAGMSGSPVYIDGKLLGAVSYAWAFGKEPIAGVTPFSQMHGFVERFERRDLVEQPGKPRRVGLQAPLHIDGLKFDTVTVAAGFEDPQPLAADSLALVPLRLPVAASGFTARSLALLREGLHGTGLVPVQGGAASGKVARQERETPLQPGGPLAVALVTGDFDLSGIGTVTHIEGDRVYGWGHPFFGLGGCEFPLMTGYIHTVLPRQNISFKMGSPLRTVGVINADVSTCIAGWMGRTPDMLPVRMTVRRDADEPRTFQVQTVRQRSLLAPLVFAVLTNSVDMEGDLPEEVTLDLQARIEIEGRAPILIKDRLSGSIYAGGRAAGAVYQPVASVVNQLTYNACQPVRIQRIDCETRILPGRRSADIESVEMDSDTYAPGETVKATVFLRPYQGALQRLPVSLTLPPDLPEGTYTATVCDDVSNARYQVRDDPNLSNPQNLEQILDALKVQTLAQHTTLALRVPLPSAGVALGGKSLPNLPPSMVQILGSTRRTGAMSMSGALVSRQPTDWVVQGSESVRFTVVKNKKTVTGE